MANDALVGNGSSPLWQWPSSWAAKWHRGIAPFLATDRRVLDRLNVGDTAVIVTLLVATGVPSFFHAISGFGASSDYTIFDLTLETVYTESIPLMAAALLIGLLAPTAGAGFVAAFAVFDLIASALSQQELTPFLPALTARVLSYWLLWLLAVEVPILIRTSVVALDRPEKGYRVLALAVAAGAGLVLTWVWTQAMTMLIRPVFTWTDLLGPSYNAVAPVQEKGEVLAVIGALGAVAVSFLHLRYAPGWGLPLFSPSETRRRPLGLVPVAVVLTVFLFAGVITTLLDLIILAGAAIIARPLAMILRRTTKAQGWLERIPWVVRFGVAFGFAFVVASVVVVPLFGVQGGSEFLPIVLAQAVVLVVYEFFLAEDEEPVEQPASVPGTAVGLFLITGLFMALLLVPLPAAADNCSSRTDCYPSPWPAAGGAAAAGGMSMFSKKKNAPPDKPPIKKARDATDALAFAGGKVTVPSIPMMLANRLLGWQFDSANDISRNLGSDPPRKDFSEIAEASTRSVPDIPHSDLLGPELTTALSSAVKAHQEMAASGEAAVISFDRYGGAKAAKAREWLEKQAVAVVRHKQSMSGPLRAAADAIEEVWRIGEGFKPTGVMPEQLLDRLTSEEIGFARALGADDAAIDHYSQRVAAGEGMAGNYDLTKIAKAYRGMATAFDRLPTPGR